MYDGGDEDDAKVLSDEEIIQINEPLPPGGLNIKASAKTSTDNIKDRYGGNSAIDDDLKKGVTNIINNNNINNFYIGSGDTEGGVGVNVRTQPQLPGPSDMKQHHQPNI